MEEESGMAIANQKEVPTDWLPPAGSGIPQRPTVQRPANEISMPVGVSEEGQAIFAHVRFDAPLKKDFLKSLRGLLEALEKGLA
jgi:hypothetical protein